MDNLNKIVLSGWLNKKKSNGLMTLFGSWNKRFFTFDGKVIKYYHNDNHENHNLFGPSGIILIRDIKNIEIEKQIPGYYFKINTSSREYCLQAENEYELSKWILNLKKYKNEHEIKKENLYNQINKKRNDDIKNFLLELKKEIKPFNKNIIKQTIKEERGDGDEDED